MRAREARIFECVVETVVAPGGGLPPVARTDAVRSFASALEASPPLNRVGLRILLRAVDAGPYLLGRRRRMRVLEPGERQAYLAGLGRGRAGPLIEALTSLAKVAYYGDVGIMRRLGYDPEANVARGRALRAAENRW